MTWQKTAEDRQREQHTYGSPEYRRNRDLAKRRAAGRCEQCGHRHPHLQADHITPVSQGGSHDLANLQVLCSGDASCKCHETKTAREGGGYRRRRKDPPPRPGTQW